MGKPNTTPGPVLARDSRVVIRLATMGCGTVYWGAYCDARCIERGLAPTFSDALTAAYLAAGQWLQQQEGRNADS